MSEKEEPAHYNLKVVIVGDKGVGKSSFIQQRNSATAKLKYYDNYGAVGIIMASSFIHVDDMVYKITYWDCPSDEAYLQFTGKISTQAAGYIYIFDLCNRSSFENLSKWISLMEPHFDKSRDDLNAVRILVGNKADNEVPIRKVEASEAEEFADDYNLDYYETSANTGVRVAEVFQELSTQVIERIPKSLDPSVLRVQGITLGSLTLNDKEKKVELNKSLRVKNPDDDYSTTVMDWL